MHLPKSLVLINKVGHNGAFISDYVHASDSLLSILAGNIPSHAFQHTLTPLQRQHFCAHAAQHGFRISGRSLCSPDNHTFAGCLVCLTFYKKNNYSWLSEAK